MRCVAFCTAESYKMSSITTLFKGKNFETKMYRGVFYVKNRITQAEMFFFPIGCFVTWGLTNQQESDLEETIKASEINRLKIIETDRFIYTYGKKTQLKTHDRFNADFIVLEEDDREIKLAISFGLAQSVKLESYEESVQQTIRNNSHIPKELAEHGRIPLSGKLISKRMGEIFLERSYVNLSSEYLDMPEYFWQYSNLEDYYTLTAKYLDLPGRVHSLNQRLDALHELFDMLTTQLQHRHSTISEWIIIILILIEIIMNFISFHIQW